MEILAICTVLVPRKMAATRTTSDNNMAIMGTVPRVVLLKSTYRNKQIIFRQLVKIHIFMSCKFIGCPCSEWGQSTASC